MLLHTFTASPDNLAQYLNPMRPGLANSTRTPPVDLDVVRRPRLFNAGSKRQGMPG